MVITWNTHKTEAGFAFRVYSVGYQIPSQELKTGICGSRAKAVSHAKKWCLYFKAKQRVAA